MDLSPEIIMQIKQIGEKYKNIEKITLYGSRARGDNKPRSDVDLAVYVNGGIVLPIFDDLENIETLLKFDVTYINEEMDKEFLAKVFNEEVAIYMGNYKNKLNNLEKGVERLKEVAACYHYDNDIIRDSMIQRFELCYELAWKTLKDYMEYNGLSEESLPRRVFKTAYEHNLIDDEKLWLDMINDRNICAHQYNEESINTIAKNIKERYLNALICVQEKLKV